MTEWIKVNETSMPKDREILSIWKCRVGIAEWCEDTNKWYFAYAPACMDLSNCSLDDEACLKFTYWAELPEPPHD